MKINDFMNADKQITMFISVDEYKQVRERLQEFYTEEQIRKIDEYCRYKFPTHTFLLCNAHLMKTVSTPMMLDNAVTFTDRISFNKIEWSKFMKKVIYEYGCRALGYFEGERYFPEEMTEKEIEQQIKDEAAFGIWIHNMEDGYEEVTEVVYKKTR